MAIHKYKLDNLCGIVDVNGLQIDGATADVMPSEPLDAKFAAFGWHVIKADGHDFDSLRAALAETAAPASLQLATAHGYRNVPVTNVLFLERILRKTRVVLTDGEELVTAAPAALLEAVPDGVFLRCHQSYWANFSHITGMEKDEFVLTGGLRVPISRSYRSAARSAFFANLRGEEG